MGNLPIFELKTPLKREQLRYKNKVYNVNSKIEVCIYKFSDSDFRSVITKDICLKNGKPEHILLDYFKESSYEDVLNITDDFLENQV